MNFTYTMTQQQRTEADGRLMIAQEKLEEQIAAAKELGPKTQNLVAEMSTALSEVNATMTLIEGLPQSKG